VLGVALIGDHRVLLVGQVLDLCIYSGDRPHKLIIARLVALLVLDGLTLRVAVTGEGLPAVSLTFCSSSVKWTFNC